MASIGDFLTGPIANLIYTYFGGKEQERAYGEAKKENLARYGQGEDIIDRLERELGPLLYNQTQREEGLSAAGRKGLRENVNDLYSRVGGGYGRRREGVLDYLGKELPGIEKGYSERTSKAVGDYDAAASGSQTGYQSLADELGIGYDEMEALVGTLGGQQKDDIDRAFKGRQAAETANLVNRGLSGSTIAPSVATGVERERSAEQRRLQDDLTRQRLAVGSERLGARERVGSEGLRNLADSSKYRADLYSRLSDEELSQRGRNVGATADAMATLSADELAALENLGKYRTESLYGANQDYLNTVQRGNDRIYQNRMNIPMTRLDWIYKRNDPYPSANWLQQLASQYGANSAQPPKPKTDWVSPTIGAAGTIGAAKLMAAVCIDQEAMIDTPRGKRALVTLNIGDAVYNHKRESRRIVNKDCGIPHRERMGDYMVLSVGRNTLLCTIEHVIDGKRADEWRVGDVIRMADETAVVTETHKCPARKSGDILLDDGSPYIANGFVVHSMFNKHEGEDIIDLDTPIPAMSPQPAYALRRRGRPRKTVAVAE